MKNRKPDLPNSQQGTKGSFEHPAFTGTLLPRPQFHMRGAPRMSGSGYRIKPRNVRTLPIPAARRARPVK